MPDIGDFDRLIDRLKEALEPLGITVLQAAVPVGEPAGGKRLIQAVFSADLEKLLGEPEKPQDDVPLDDGLKDQLSQLEKEIKLREEEDAFQEKVRGMKQFLGKLDEEDD